MSYSTLAILKVAAYGAGEEQMAGGGASLTCSSQGAEATHALHAWVIGGLLVLVDCGHIDNHHHGRVGLMVERGLRVGDQCHASLSESATVHGP
jgi:hypothetical protein